MSYDHDSVGTAPVSATVPAVIAGPAARSPWSYVPTLYFAEGVPYILINTVSVILYTRLGVDTATMAFWTSWLYLPWVIKMFWGPLVDVVSTKRRWILGTQLALFAVFAFVAFSLGWEHFFAASLAGFITGAFISATHDIAVDGYYMLALDKADQAFFVGIRSTFYRIAMIFGSGLLVYTAGKLEQLPPAPAGAAAEATAAAPLDAYSQVLRSIVTAMGAEPGNRVQAWMLVFGAVAVLFLGIALYHALMLPFPKGDGAAPTSSEGGSGEKVSFAEAIGSYFRQPGIGRILAFILLYRFGEAMLVKLASPFLLADPAAGGLGLQTDEVGVAYGTIGLLSLVGGGILGGMAIARFGFRTCIWPMAFAMNVPDVFYVLMAYYHPPKALAYLLIAIEQFGYGFGFTAFTVYLMFICVGQYKTSHFAISTGIMALGMMLPGFISGWVQQALGYPRFFIFVCLCTIPGFLVIPFILKDPRIDEGETAACGG